MTVSKAKTLAVSGLLSGAVIWGAIWYPYRLLQGFGVGGVLSTLLTYLIPLVLGLFLYRVEPAKLRRAGWLAAWIGISAAWTNLAYVLAVIRGEIMHVLLLFYLSPFWTVIFSRLLLGERPKAVGYGVMALSLGGAVVMLWRPEFGLPLPRNGAEWLGLSAGLSFALSNVLARKAEHIDVEMKSLVIWTGVVVLAALVLPLVEPAGLRPLTVLSAPGWAWLLAVGAMIFGVTLSVQYGLAHTPANQAIVIFLFELVVAAVTSYWLAGEAMTAREWLGGAMIVAASLFSGELEQE